MRIFHDEDEWETRIEHRPCTSCDGNLRKCNGACNGMSGYSLVRRDPGEVKKIKAENIRAREDAILAQAAVIRARRHLKG